MGEIFQWKYQSANKIVRVSSLYSLKSKGICWNRDDSRRSPKKKSNCNSFLFYDTTTTDTSTATNEMKTDSAETMPGSNGRTSEDNPPKMTDGPLVVGCLTWARLESSPFWPSIIICDKNPVEDDAKKIQVQVYFICPKQSKLIF